MIKIGIDGRLLQGNLTGVGKYVLNLVNYICDSSENINFSIYTNREISCDLNAQKVKVISDTEAMSKIKPMVWSKLFSYRLVNNDDPDIFFAGDAFVPLYIKTKKIVSVVHDFNSIIAPETMSRLRFITDKLFFKRDLKKASIIISNSYGTAAKLENYFGKRTNLVIYPIIDKWYKMMTTDKVKTKLCELGIRHPYILTVATQEPRKNLDKTIKAFAALKRKGVLKNYKLLLIGSKGWKSADIDRLLQSHNNIVQHLGYVSDSNMPFLYSGADLFVFPSSYEGFGMPAREAMLCGVNVITSDIAELREATFNSAVYIDPESQIAFEEAILNGLIKKSKQEFTIPEPKNNDQLSQLISALSC